MITDHEAALEIMRLQAEIERWRDATNRLRSEMEAQSLRANNAEAETARLMEEIKSGWSEANLDTTNAFLRADNARLLEDKERMDWLDKTPGSVYASVDPDGNRLQHFVAVNESNQSSRRGNVRASIREAIDAARAALAEGGAK